MKSVDLKAMDKDVEEILSDPKVQKYLERADSYLEHVGYTKHGYGHASRVASRAGDILRELGYSDREIRLAGIAGGMHDIGNMIGRINHGLSSAIIARDLLQEMGLDLEDILDVMVAVSSHEEETGQITDAISAAVVIADKTDVQRSRVRSTRFINFDIHDRVNYAATKTDFSVDAKQKIIRLSLDIDTEISQVMEYFEIFLERMLVCKRAARFLGCEFQLVINGVKLS